jgi:hypothetical protein
VHRLDGSTLWHFGVTYTLTLTDQAWRIASTTPNAKLVAN